MNNSSSDTQKQHFTPITIDALEEALHWHSPFENMLRSYYLEHHRFMPIAEFPEELLQPFSIPPIDLRSLTGTSDVTLSPTNTFQTAETFLEPQYFSPGYDIYIQKQPRYSCSPTQDHQYYEICYQYSGTSIQTLSVDNTCETIRLKPGDFIFIPVAQKHSITINSDSILLNIGVRASTFTQAFSHNIPDGSILGDFFSSLLTPDGDSIRYLVFHTNGDAMILQQIQQLSLTYCTNTLYSQQILNLQLSILFMNLLQDYSYNTKIANTSGSITEKLPAIMQYIEQNYTTSSAQRIAQHFGYSPDYLNQLFKKTTSHTIGETLLNLKMQKAASLLTSTNLSVSSIAEYLGYQDTTNLIRSFKKYYGSTPAQYRKAHLLS